MSTMIGPCPKPEDLAAWLEGGLSPADRRPVTAHLAGCDDCRRSVGVAQLVEAPPPAALDEALLARVVRASRRRPVWPWAAAAAAGLFALGVAAWVSRPEPRPLAEEPRVAVPDPVVVHEPSPPPPRVEEPAKEAPVAVAPKAEPAPRTEEPAKPAPEPPKPAPVEEPKKEVVKAPPSEAPKPEPAPAPKETKTDLSAVFGSVFAVDATGDLWLRREGGEGARVGTFEQAGWTDTFSSREGGGFTLDARASVALEKGAEVGLSWFKPDQAYSIHVGQGLVLVDTEGATCNFRVTRGGSTVAFTGLNGCLAVEPRGEQVAATLLRGRSDLKVGAEVRKAAIGREVVLAADGKVSDQPGETKKKLDRLLALRPKVSTLFAASFDEKKDEVSPFPYTVVVGRVATGPAGYFLEAINLAQKPTDKPEMAAALKPDRAIQVTSDMVLAFRYRTSAPSFQVRFGAHAATVTVPRGRSGQWTEAVIRRDAFTHEGVELVPSAEVAEVRFTTGVVDRRAGTLEVDAVQFLRRAR